MSVKGSYTTSDYLDFDATMMKALKTLKAGKKDFKIAFLTILSINVGLRISDTLLLKHHQLQEKEIILCEKKTGKRRIITLNENVRGAYEIYCSKLARYSGEDFVFISQNRKAYSARQVNRVLKKLFGTRGKNVSTHSLRKTFGRRVWENDNYSERSLILLNQLFGHSSINTTKIYLSLQQEEIQDIYLNL
jgi:site-specific recombinase XerD